MFLLRSRERAAVQTSPLGMVAHDPERRAGKTDSAQTSELDPPGREQESATNARAGAPPQQDRQIAHTLGRDNRRCSVFLKVEALCSSFAQDMDKPGQEGPKGWRQVLQSNRRSKGAVKVRPSEFVGIQLDRQPEPRFAVLHIFSIMHPMLGRITEKTFYQFLKCPNWVYLGAHAFEKRVHAPLMERLMDDGLIHEKERELISDREDLVEVTAEDPEEAHRQTLVFMREGRGTIYRGVLMDKHWVGHPDLLERVEGRSALGDYYYVAVDLKRSRFLRDEFKFQGCFYAALLARIQKVKPLQGYVINPDGLVMSYHIGAFEGEFDLTLDEIEKIMAGQKPPHFVTSGCKQSPWFSECVGEAQACDEISLLNRVWRKEVSLLEQAGVKTITQLSLMSVTDLERTAPEVSPARLEIMRDQAVAITEHRHIVRRAVALPEARTELYFDIESDPLRDFDYLFGVLEVRNGEGQYHPFFAASPAHEKEMWEEFVGFIERHLDCPIYHYGWFEQEVVHRFLQRYGISALAREALERNMVDLLELLRPAVIFPLSFYSLKDIASYVGYTWRSQDASGANSVIWFEEWLKNKSQKMMQKILEYNEDDVRATFRLQRWLREHAT
ncbi:TM0106 family RecB-like putative nuclease [Candidatus Parcubacteria bacterium]|nr:TM0106 family RecB-like putative nuclease [Candidatus Parcubacteria bacterium]